jgi:hypothetical protein
MSNTDFFNGFELGCTDAVGQNRDYAKSRSSEYYRGYVEGHSARLKVENDELTKTHKNGPSSCLDRVMREGWSVGG